MLYSGLKLAVVIAALILTPGRPLLAVTDTPTQAGSESAEQTQQQNRTRLVSMWQPGDPGQRMNIRGRVSAIDGSALAGVAIYVRQADGSGDYSERYSTLLETDIKGRYQFGSVVPGQYYGVKHVHLTVMHEGYRSLDTEILFKGDPNLDDQDAPNAIFLEEASVKGETILYGRFDITLVPE